MTSDDPNADWWCWTEDGPSKPRCRDLSHDVRPGRKPDDDLEALEASDPAVRDAAARLDETTTTILSTSARLRQTQRDLAASQADLTRARAERDLARSELASARQELARLRAAGAEGTAVAHA